MFLVDYKGNNFFAPLGIFMSGIAGIVGVADDIELRLAAMLRSQEHRAMQGRGFWISSFDHHTMRLGVAHCGCSVSELNEDVRQPYVDDELQLIVVLEGDIYNCAPLREELRAHYTFDTDSAVELLAKAFHRWGDACLQYLEGAFVVVIYDRREDSLLLARDRFGVKPLYYTVCKGTLYFASEVRSLFAAGVERRLSTERWASYLLYSTYGPVHTTFWDGVYQLPAGSAMRYEGNYLDEFAWYNLHDDILEYVLDYDAVQLEYMLVEELRRVIDQSLCDVSCCALRVAGRVESQMLHHLADKSRHQWKIHTFTGDIDRIGRQPTATPVWVTASHAVSELEQMSQWVEEPFDGSDSIVRTVMFRQVGREGVPVVISGVGLDVLWQDEWDITEHRYNYPVRHDLFTRVLSTYAELPCYKNHFSHDDDNMRYLELAYERIQHILRFFDRSAAEAGITVRLPFLDRRLVALSFALPMMSRSERRHLFGRCLNNHKFTAERIEQHSFLSQWASGGMQEWVGDALSDMRRGSVREWFDARQLEHLWQEYRDGTLQDIALLWKCLSLHRQLRE